jgi:hypothetical protein
LIAAAITHAGTALSSARFDRLTAALAIGVTLFAAWLSPRLPPMLPLGLGVSLRDQPAASARWLETSLPAARLLASTDDAWFLMFSVPKARFVIDGRIPFYGPEHAQRVQRALASPPHLGALIAELEVDTLVLRLAHRDHAAAHRAIRNDARFGLAVIEDDHVTYVRRDRRLYDGELLRPLRLEPSYDPGWLLDADASEQQRIRRELARLPAYSGSDGYRGWVNGLLELRPVLRADGRSGLDHSKVARESARLERASVALAVAAKGALSVPIVHAYRAIVQIERCELDAAEASLALAEREGESRDTLLPRQELSLKRGEREAVRSFVQAAAQVPALAGDPWLAALRQRIATAAPCAD